MRWIRGAAVVVAVAAAAGGVAMREARAGNGTAPAPAGTIYFQDLSTLDASTNTIMLYAMDGDGENRTAILRTDRYVRPSRLLHGSKRWFLTMKTIEGEEIGGNPRRDVYAVRADGTEVRLTSDPTVEYWMPDWMPPSDRVSMLGRRWTGTDPEATVVPFTAGMYFLGLTFDESGEIADVDGNPFPEVFFFDASADRDDSVAYYASVGGPTPDVGSYSWSPTGDLAVQDLSVDRPRIRPLPNGEGDFSVYLDYRIDGQDPEWGPDPSRIAFRSLAPATNHGVDSWSIETVEAMGGRNRFTEASVPRPANASTTRSLARPKFSPDGNHIAYQLVRHGEGTTNYILRETVGHGPKDLSPDLKPAAAGETGMVLVDWR